MVLFGRFAYKSFHHLCFVTVKPYSLPIVVLWRIQKPFISQGISWMKYLNKTKKTISIDFSKFISIYYS